MEQDIAYDVWMGAVDPYMDEAFIMSAFEQVGHPCKAVKRVFNRITNVPAGYCFVEFSNQVDGEKAVRQLSGNTNVPGSNPPRTFRLNIGKTQKVAPLAAGAVQKEYFSVFVGDVSVDVTDEKLGDFFGSRYPSMVSAVVQKDGEGRGRGYGFVRFSNREEFQHAVKNCDGALGCGNKKIRVNEAKTRMKEGGPAPKTTPAFFLPPKSTRAGSFLKSQEDSVKYTKRDPSIPYDSDRINDLFIKNYNLRAEQNESLHWPAELLR
eukprot:m.262501 g.262501  ORF g.262501 m.262501 type:complete len:264 (+) comp45816_c0_seq1:104-895(+)